MGNPEEDLAVRLIFMLAVSEPHAEVNLLRVLMGIVQNQATLQGLLDAPTDLDLFKRLEDMFQDIVVDKEKKEETSK